MDGAGARSMEEKDRMRDGGPMKEEPKIEDFGILRK